MGDWRGRGGAVQRDFGLEDTPLALEARVRSPLQAPASAGNDEARRQQMIRERAVEVRLRARVPRTRLARARALHGAHAAQRTRAQRREAAGHRGAYRRARHTLCAVRSASICAQLLRFKATATETDAQHETRGSVRAEQADSEAFVVEQAIRLIEGGPEENVLDR